MRVGDLETEQRMNGLDLPSWTVPVVGLAAAVWAISMWWMVATMPAAANSDADLRLVVANAEIEQLQVAVDELQQQLTELHQDRTQLTSRLETLERVPIAAQLSLAGPAPTHDNSGDDTTTPISPSNASPTPTATPTQAPTPRPTVQPTAQPTVQPAAQPLRNNRDLYNCRDFETWEQAQAVFEANLPGDPNHIDMDSDGVACEALKN